MFKPNASHARSQQSAWLAPMLGGILLGTALQLQQVTLWPLLVYAQLLPLALILYVFTAIKNNKLLCLDGGQKLCRVIIFTLFAFALTGLRASFFVSRTLAPVLEGHDLTLTGIVADMAQPFALGQRFRFAAESAVVDSRPVAIPGLIDLAWYVADGVLPAGQTPLPRAGERWRFNARIKAVHGSVNPHGFDYELWQWEQGVQATGYVRNGAKDPMPTRLAPASGYMMARWREQVRQQIEDRLADPASSGLIAALLVGDQKAIDREDWSVFRATGVAHLLSISGLHITMFAWLAARVVGWLWRRSGALCLRLPAASAALLGGILLALLYALFSGFGVPAQRTVLMLTCVGLLRLSGVRWPWPLVWLLACVAVVMLDPWAILQAGFWLSFVAVGILFAAETDSEKPGHKVAGSRVIAFFREQWVITLALAPLSLLLFGQVSLIGIPANALAIPWVTLLLTPMAMLGVVVPGLWEFAAWTGGWMMAVLRWMASMPWALWSVSQAPTWAALAAFLGGITVAMRLPASIRWLGVPLLLPVVFWQVPRPLNGTCEVLAADVGQGSAVLVRTAQHSLMFDAGPRYGQDSDAGQRVLVPLLRALGERLDRLVLSHRDSDHTGGALALLAMQPQTALLSSFETELKTGQRCEAGMHWQWDGVVFRVLHPFADDKPRSRSANATSCVLHVSTGESSALLTGDIEVEQERHLVDTAVLAADLLVVPHHGSKTSSSVEFLEAVQPRVAVVQSGYRNRFGHPDATVMLRYQERSILVLDTPHCGAVMWRSGADPSIRCQREVAPHYWQHKVPN